MSNTIAAPWAAPISPRAPSAPTASAPYCPTRGHREGHSIAEILGSLSAAVSPQRRLVRAGDFIHQTGQHFEHLYILNSGFFKIVTLSPDGREQVVGLKLRGDWLGFDGIAQGAYACDAVAMDTGEVWAIRYESLLVACIGNRRLLAVLHEAMSRQISHQRDSLMSVCTLPADARVAEFLRTLAESLATSGQRADEISLRMTRAEIGNYLGLTLETVSRALSRLAKHKVIGFAPTGRRDLHIPNLDALSAFAQSCMVPTRKLQPIVVKSD
jgi:CRP/FNR family transcriptional regulator